MASRFVLEAVVFFLLSDSQQHKLVLHEVVIASCDFNTRMLNYSSMVTGS